MTQYRFRIVNVFAETTFGGNPLCVFEDGRGLSDEQMLALARQFNLSETTFVLPSVHADARVRVFAPGYEMRFAGHPTLGTAHVVRQVAGIGDHMRLEFQAGIVPVQADGDSWMLTAPGDSKPRVRSVDRAPAVVASLLGLKAEDLLDEPLWVDTGADQLLVPLRSADAVRRAHAVPALLDQWPPSSLGRKTAYVFAFVQDADGHAKVVARYFFTVAGGAVGEDPGTGSACANLGGWLISTGRVLPAALRVEQGDEIGRPCRLRLEVDRDRRIRVGGRVLELGRGVIEL